MWSPVNSLRLTELLLSGIVTCNFTVLNSYFGCIKLLGPYEGYFGPTGSWFHSGIKAILFVRARYCLRSCQKPRIAGVTPFVTSTTDFYPTNLVEKPELKVQRTVTRRIRSPLRRTSGESRRSSPLDSLDELVEKGRVVGFVDVVHVPEARLPNLLPC